MAERIARLRIFADEQDRMNRSVIDVGGSVLCVSQFTLYGDVARGNRPGFTGAAPPDEGRVLVDAVADQLRLRRAWTCRPGGSARTCGSRW